MYLCIKMMMHDKCVQIWEDAYEVDVLKLYTWAYRQTCGWVTEPVSETCRFKSSASQPGKALRNCRQKLPSRACPARTPSALELTLSLPAQGPTSAPTLSSKSDNVSFSIFFHSHDTLWGRYFKEIIKRMNSYKSKLKTEALFSDLPIGQASSYFSDVLHGLPAHGFLAAWAGAEARGRASAAPGTGLPGFSRACECSAEGAELSLFSSILCSFSCL